MVLTFGLEPNPIPYERIVPPTNTSRAYFGVPEGDRTLVSGITIRGSTIELQAPLICCSKNLGVTYGNRTRYYWFTASSLSIRVTSHLSSHLGSNWFLLLVSIQLQPPYQDGTSPFGLAGIDHWQGMLESNQRIRLQRAALCHLTNPQQNLAAQHLYDPSEPRIRSCSSSSSYPERCTTFVPCAKDGGTDGSRTRLNLLDREVPDR